MVFRKWLRQSCHPHTVPSRLRYRAKTFSYRVKRTEEQVPPGQHQTPCYDVQTV
jgi:hypothetical protein